MSMFPGQDAAPVVAAQTPVVPEQGMPVQPAPVGVVPQVVEAQPQPGQLDLSGLETRFSPEEWQQIQADLLAQNQQAADYHVSRVQSALDRQIAAANQRVQQLEAALEQTLMAQAQPHERLELQQQLAQRRLDQERQQLQEQFAPIQQEQARMAVLQRYAAEWQVPIEQLMDTTSPRHAYEKAVALHYAGQAVPRIPQHQMQNGPSGGAGRPFQMPAPNTPEFQQMMEEAKRTGRAPWRG